MPRTTINAKKSNGAQERFESPLTDAGNLPNHIRLYEHPKSPRHMGSYAYMSKLSHGVPYDGYYFFAFDATALHRIPPTNRISQALEPRNPSVWP